jgi:hypothetical protein
MSGGRERRERAQHVDQRRAPRDAVYSNGAFVILPTGVAGMS